MSNLFKNWDPALAPPPTSYWYQKAIDLWPGLLVQGDGRYVFVSRCEGVIYLFHAIPAAKEWRCRAESCDPLRGHERKTILGQPPQRAFRLPGTFEK